MKVIPLNQPPIKLNITLENMPYKVRRSVLVPANIHMFQLHLIIQIVFQWENDHLFQFSDKKSYNAEFSIRLPLEGDNFSMSFNRREILDPFKVQLEQLLSMLPKSTLYYEYDFGDSWMHKITLGKLTAKDAKLFTGAPILVAANGKTPPEDSGGSWGYHEFCEAINNKKHPQYKELREWMLMEKNEVYNFDLEDDDIDFTNLELSNYFHSDDWNINIEDIYED